MRLDPEWIRSLADATGFRPAALEKVLRLGSLAADVSRHPYLSKVLALKGGAALNLCFGAPRRLSVDLDFNYIAALDRSRMLEERPQVEKALGELGRRQGYEVQRSADEHAGAKWVESTAGAVAVGRAYLLLALSSASASISRPWLRFPPPLIEPDVRISRIRLSDWLHEGHARVRLSRR